MGYQAELQFAARTDTGLVRSHNEDSVTVNPVHGLAILADGMGGYNAGEVASGMATTMLMQSLQDKLQNFEWNLHANRGKYLQTLVIEAIEHVNFSIFDESRNKPQYAGMGTTLVMALFHHDKAIVAHVGDSRAYCFRKGALVPITRDHSMLQEQIDAGLMDPEWARFSPNRNLVTRAMGINYSVDVEIHEHLTEQGDIYLLCSDGLTDMLGDREIGEILATEGPDLDAVCDALIKRSNDNGGRDNTSAILIRVASNNVETKGLFERVLNWAK